MCARCSSSAARQPDADDRLLLEELSGVVLSSQVAGEVSLSSEYSAGDLLQHHTGARLRRIGVHCISSALRTTSLCNLDLRGIQNKLGPRKWKYLQQHRRQLPRAHAMIRLHVLSPQAAVMYSRVSWNARQRDRCINSTLHSTVPCNTTLTYEDVKNLEDDREGSTGTLCASYCTAPLLSARRLRWLYSR